MIYCPNPACQTANSETSRFCEKCRTFLQKHYLWAVGEGTAALKPGDLLSDRYLCKQGQIFLDTRPALLPQSPIEISPVLAAYLRLVAYTPHIPQPYSVVSHRGQPILLLDQVPLDVSGGQAGVRPSLSQAWKSATGFRQVHWLWQIAQLWQPLSQERVASSLLNPQNLRIEGALVRLLELQSDSSTPPTLVHLGQVWQEWLPDAQPTVAAYLERLCQSLIQKEIRTAEQLVTQLDRALELEGRSHPPTVQVSTRTDQGPNRKRNEDACYPADSTPGSATAPPYQLVIVCDGIGGHEGGNIASNLAIATIQEHIAGLDWSSFDPVTLSIELEKAACVANDRISQRNDSERRQDRQRMGTTLVMALVRGHEVYITHVGDSRAYLITQMGCHQLTLDDDVASREVRLGYALYRDALQQPASGALVQALGMGPSNILHPTVQRFILDEPCVFLLCSDGLSDCDRVEEYWQTEIVPLLDGKTDIETVSQQLIHIGNTRNGHDNVTVGVIHCQVPVSLVGSLSADGSVTPAILSVPDLAAEDPETASLDPEEPPVSTLKTQLLPHSEQPPRRFSWPILLGVFLVLGVGGFAVYQLVLQQSQTAIVDSTPTSPASSIESLRTPTLPLEPQTVLQVRAAGPGENALPRITLLNQPDLSPGTPSSPATALGQVPAGSVLQVLRRQVTGKPRPTDSGALPDTLGSEDAQVAWLQVRVCSIPTPQPTPPTAPPTGSLPSLQPGIVGWVPEAEVLPALDPSPPTGSEAWRACTP